MLTLTHTHTHTHTYTHKKLHSNAIHIFLAFVLNVFQSVKELAPLQKRDQKEREGGSKEKKIHDFFSSKATKH